MALEGHPIADAHQEIAVTSWTKALSFLSASYSPTRMKYSWKSQLTFGYSSNPSQLIVALPGEPTSLSNSEFMTYPRSRYVLTGIILPKFNFIFRVLAPMRWFQQEQSFFSRRHSHTVHLTPATEPKSS
jgi:hypothetical protein